PRPLARRQELSTGKQRLLQSIERLDEQHTAGTIAEGEYQQRRQAEKMRLLALEQQLRRGRCRKPGPTTTIAMAASPKLNPNRRHQALPDRYPLRGPPARLLAIASLSGDALFLSMHGNVHMARPGTPGERCSMSRSIYRSL